MSRHIRSYEIALLCIAVIVALLFITGVVVASGERP